MRAMRPSSVSKTPASTIAITAGWKRPSTPKRMAVRPAQSANTVKMLGISLLSEKSLRRWRGLGANI